MKSIAKVKVEFDIDYFKKMMNEKNLTRKELSYITGVDITSIYNYSCGYRVPISRSLYKISLALDCTM